MRGNFSTPAASITVSRSITQRSKLDLGDFPVGESIRAGVVANQTMLGAQRFQDMRPTQARHLKLEVTAPIPRFDNWRPCPL